MKEYQNIKVENESSVCWITLNRPDSRNALDGVMLSNIEEALIDAENDDQVKVIVFQGAGEKSFAAGADINQLKERTSIEALVPGMQALYTKIENCKKATIAAVKGFALGGGCELSLACDIRIATKNAKFGLPELNLGIIPGAGGTQRLTRMVGKSRALDMILTGKIIDGEEAERIGLVNYFVDGEDYIGKVEEVAASIAKKGPIAIHLAKFAVHKGSDLSEDAGMWIEKLSQSIVFGTEDKNEGTSAFLEKRKPDFNNR
ncbi:enoyl-CoA hydratase [Halalkalibacillus sediminis]|uniref:Enoyl-CoA hydratase n=1 Tax=Halalkalibacillus sediminis TaxID=2018042 RepID=A0A2I0QU80_9BACI|nr:enoyl-CoA hydratase-related protein [Halalkalibacillus sediminis]PKR77891.1 enoyl-CoA hydratase [Halalkalibacillus sediminis]